MAENVTVVGPLEYVTAERDRYLAAIRKHRDYRGDNRCHLDDGELYAVLPEGDTRPAREAAVTLENCARYIDCRQQGREYVSPQTRIEELQAAAKALNLYAKLTVVVLKGECAEAEAIRDEADRPWIDAGGNDAMTALYADVFDALNRIDVPAHVKELEAQVAKLQETVKGMAQRIAAQSDVIAVFAAKAARVRESIQADALLLSPVTDAADRPGDP